MAKSEADKVVDPTPAADPREDRFADENVEVPSDDASAGDVQQAMPDAGTAEKEDSAEEAEDGEPAETSSPSGADGDDDEAPEATPETKEASPPPAPATPDPEVVRRQLLREIGLRTTRDPRATAALAEAEAAGATTRQLAEAAKSRGDALHASPERAGTFYKWAADKDETYPEPVFALARQAALVGEVDEVKRLLAEVRKRGGRRLLQQIDFDPTWDIVKDDPAVQALLR